MLLKGVFWGSLGALAWTHVAYPAAAELAARLRPRQVRKDEGAEPSVTVIIPAHNEERVIERRLENLVALDYPRAKLEIVVASDASTDRTNEIVEAVAASEQRVSLLACPRGGKVATQDRAVRQATSEIVAFSDGNSTWAPDALRHLVAALADTDVAYVCGQLRLETVDGTNREGTYWRYEVRLRKAESRLGSITGGNGSIYAVKRADYVEVDPRWGHDLSFPYRMVQEGRRAVYEPAAHAFEKPTPSNETEYRRKVRMFEHCWEITLRGSMFRRLPAVYLVEIVSHRLLRYGSGVLHLALLASSVALAADGLVVRDRARRPGGADRGRCCGRSDRPLLRTRHVGHGGRALELPAARCSRDVGCGGGDTLNRALDVASAAAGLVLTSPLLAATAIAIKLEDGGPVLYRQTRVGRDGEDFELLKLRTMVVGAETKGAGFAVDRGDSRITRVGRLLRRTSVDELPQLWNVLRGDMSLIGPRPTLRYQVDTYTDRQRQRLAVRPGLTGWAQVNGRATLPWEERIELDVWYVEHRSPRVDLKILLRTPAALLGGTYRGARGGWRRDDAR